MKIIAHRIIKEENIEKLSSKLNEMMEDGWEPFGGPVLEMITPEDSTNYSNLRQAMVKYEE